MIKIGVITDVHGNLPALEAALEAITAEGCETVIHTGDAIGIGPFPAECLDVLLNRPHTSVLMGNHDALFADGLPVTQPSWMRGGEYEHQLWTHAQLNADLREVVAAWPYILELTLGPGQHVQFCHYGRKPDNSGFAPVILDPTPSDLDDIFASHADLVFYGHHHPTSDLHGKSRYINPGALGCHVLPEARFAVLSVEDDGSWNVALRSVEYDRPRLIRAFAQRNVVGGPAILHMFFGQ